MAFSKAYKNYFKTEDGSFSSLSITASDNAYHVLLFGETGSGKSTLINYLTNYFRKGTLKKLKIAIPTKFLKDTEGFKSREKDLNDPKKSKTTDCYSYDFQSKGIVFHFIDTPGLSDTEGVQNDEEHLNKIMNSAEKSERLAAIVIVINGTVARATVNLRHTLIRMKGSLPDALLDNLVVVLTNCNAASANFDLTSLHPWKVPAENVFYMENSAFSKPPSDWQKNPKMLKQLEVDWDNSMEEIERMVKRFKELGFVGTQVFRVMRENREIIKAKVAECLLEIKKLQTVQDELEAAQLAQQGIQTDITKYSNFKTTRQVSYTKMEETDEHNTLCMQHADKVCHQGCGLEYTTTVGDKIFTGCACMSGSTCTECGCDHASHYHAKKMPKQVSDTVEEILQDVKAMYDMNMDKQKQMQSRISNLQSDLATLTNALKVKEDEIKQCCIKLKEICSQFNFVAELKSVIDTMEANKSSLTSMHVRQEADNMIRNFICLADELTAQPDMQIALNMQKKFY